jgi:hypothetical protein
MWKITPVLVFWFFNRMTTYKSAESAEWDKKMGQEGREAVLRLLVMLLQFSCPASSQGSFTAGCADESGMSFQISTGAVLNAPLNIITTEVCLYILHCSFILYQNTIQNLTIKGQSHKIFYLWFFSPNNITGATDSWAKAVSNIDSCLRRYTTTKKSPIFNFILLP